MRPKWRAAAVFLILSLLLAGCWDRSELEDQYYNVIMGLDRGDEGLIMVSAGVALPQYLATGILGAPAKPSEPRLAFKLLTAQAQTITQALYILNGGLTRRLDLRQLRTVIIGEALAREGVEPLLMELNRNSLARSSGMVIQARGRAFDLLRSLDPVGEVNPGRLVDGLNLQAKQIHLAPPVRLHHFIVRMVTPGGDPYMPSAAINPWVTSGPQEPPKMTGSAKAGDLPRGGGNPMEFIGTAIYHRDRLAGFLTVDETQMFMALRGEMGKAYTTFPDPTMPDQPVTLRFHQENKPTRTATFRGNRPHVDVRLLFEGEVLAMPGGTDYVETAMRMRLEKAATRYAEGTIRGLLTKLNDWEADPVGFGQLFRGKFATAQEWKTYNWQKHVKDLQVNVTVEMRVRRYGLLTGPDRIMGER